MCKPASSSLPATLAARAGCPTHRHATSLLQRSHHAHSYRPPIAQERLDSWPVLRLPQPEINTSREKSRSPLALLVCLLASVRLQFHDEKQPPLRMAKDEIRESLVALDRGSPAVSGASGTPMDKEPSVGGGKVKDLILEFRL